MLVSPAGAQIPGDLCELNKYIGPTAGYFDLGTRVAAHGDLVVATTEPTNTDPGSQVHVYRRQGATLVYETQLLTPVPLGSGTADFFSQAIAAHGDTVVVADRFFNEWAGKVLVFRKTGGVWAQEATINPPPTPEPNIEFGAAVAIEGDTMAVTAKYTGIGGDGPLGAVYIYRRSGTVWSFDQTINNPSTVPWTAAEFGVAATLKDGALVFTASNTSNDPTDPGAAYIYRDGPTGFTYEATLQPELWPATVDDLNAGFGESVAIDGDVCVVGAPYMEASVFIWHKINGTWTRVQKITRTVLGPSGFGRSIALRAGDGSQPTTLIVADPETSPSGTNSGALYVYEGTASYGFVRPVWAEDAGTAKRFGSAVALSGDALVVGSTGANALYLLGGIASDCDADGTTDLCEIDAGAVDANLDGVPDSCQTPACRADFDNANGVQVADIFAFLRAWFANDASADFDGMNGIQVADIFSFLRAWFAGC